MFWNKYFTVRNIMIFNLLVCIEYLLRVGYSIYPVVLGGICVLYLCLELLGYNRSKKEEGYTGENEKWLQFNKRIVIRREEDGVAYLIRRTLISFGKWFSIKYHQILQSDDVCSHDHPWGFVTIILKGGYYEWTPILQKERGKILANRISVDGETVEVKRWHGAGSIMYRPAKWKHRLELDKKRHFKNDELDEFIAKKGEVLIPAHTLVFTFKVVRDWGFFTKNGWIFWEKYNKLRDC